MRRIFLHSVWSLVSDKMNALKEMNFLKTPRIYWFAIKQNLRAVALILVCTALSGALQGAALLSLVPLLNQASGTATKSAFLGRVFAALFGKTRVPSFGFLIGCFFLFGATATLCKFFSELLLARFRGGTERQLCDRMMAAIGEIGWERYLDLRLGNLAQVIISDGSRFSDGCERLVRALCAATVALLLLSLALWQMPVATLLLGGTVVFGIVVHRIRFLRFSHLSQERAVVSTRFAELAIETFTNWKYLKATGSDVESIRRVGVAVRELEMKQILAAAATSSRSVSLEFASVVAVALCFCYGLVWHSVNISELIVLLGIFTRITPPLLGSQNLYSAAKSQQFGALSWLDLYRRVKSGAIQSSGTGVPSFARCLEMREVAYEYPRNGERAWSMHNMSWRLPPGGVLALIGDSGSGKSTLLDLITGLLAPTAGEVLLDGISVRDLDIRSWRQRIGIVPQNSPLFYGTILENVAGGGSHPDYIKAIRCLEMAQAMPFIASLPLGIETNIGDSGNKLSGGQRQRIAIARALYRDPWLLILDEATSSLDSENESAVMAVVAQLKRKIAIILVTHRLELAAIADEVILLGDGSIKRRGPWSQFSSKPIQPDSTHEANLAADCSTSA